MMQENKELLLKDISARLPYGVKCEIKGEKEVYTLNRIEIDYKNGHLFDFSEQKNGFNMQVYSSEVKPYLYPLSSMTTEQEKEYDNLNCWELGCFPHTEEALDYLIANHFDYRGLIEKGLAINATKLNIY